jgi:hypothetical protein
MDMRRLYALTQIRTSLGPSRYSVVDTEHPVRRGVGRQSSNQVAEQIGERGYIACEGRSRLLLMAQEFEARSPSTGAMRPFVVQW